MVYPEWLGNKEPDTWNYGRSKRRIDYFFSSNPELLKEFKQEIKKLEKTCNLILIVDELDSFRSLPFEFKETNKEFTDFMNNIVIDGIQYKEEFFLWLPMERNQ